MSARRIHPFPARMAPDIALGAIPELSDEALTILDPMCGSGTVLAAAMLRGHNAVGVDIDPLAVMMSTLVVTHIDSSKLTACADGVLRVGRKRTGLRPWGDDAETDDFVNYWFAPGQKEQLVGLAAAISAIREPDLQLALRVALSRIIVTKTSQASLAADTAHSRPHRVRTESDYDVFSGFEHSVIQLARMLDRRTLKGVGRVELGDARNLEGVEDGSVDLTVTSPPYLNALDYLRGHRLALVWFGYKVGELRKRRSVSIGAERGLDSKASEAVCAVVDAIEFDVQDKSKLRRPMIERFAHDCIEFAVQVHTKIRPGGTAVLVVGNSTLRGNYIKNDFIARTAMEHAGFTFRSSQTRPIPASSRYMAINTGSSQSTISRRMRDEVVLTMTR